MSSLGELVMFIGGMIVVFGALSLLNFGDSEDEEDSNKDNKELKKAGIKIAGGLVVAGIGMLMRHFGV